MNKFINLFLILLCGTMLSCEYSNIEDKYLTISENPGNNNPQDTLPNPQLIDGEIAYYALDGNLSDSSGNCTPLLLIGDTSFVEGINEDYGSGLHLNGSSYLLVKLGYYDTLSMVFWIKGDDELSEVSQPVLFDYGQNALSANLDASTGATALTVNSSEQVYSSTDTDVEYLNSFTRYSFFYLEARGTNSRVLFKGYSMAGTEIVYDQELDITGLIDPHSEVMYIGRSSIREGLQQSYFQGAIDEIHVYNKPLTEIEIESFAFIHTN